MNKKRIALLLNAFILPGLGQLYLGRKVMGVAIVMVLNLLLLIALFVVLKGLSPVIAAKMASGALDTNQVLAALHNVAGFGKGVLSAIVLVWVFALVDLVRHWGDP